MLGLDFDVDQYGLMLDTDGREDCQRRAARIACTASGLTRVLRSPASSPSQAERTTRRMSFMLRVRGRSGKNTTSAGLKVGKCSLPVCLADPEDIKRAFLLGDTGLIDAEVPGRGLGAKGCIYVGGALIQRLTALGTALVRRNGSCSGT